MKQKSVGLTLRATILALALILVAGSPALPPFDGVAYAQDAEVTSLDADPLPNGTLPLTWTEVVGADSYRLWKGGGSGQSVAWGEEVHMTFDAPTVSYVDTAVTAGMTYSYVIEVYDGDTRLGWSDVENVTMPGGTQKPTAKPTVTLAADGLTAITVTWTEVSGADNYRVRYWTSGLRGWMNLATAETGLTITHSNLEPGGQYYYIVRGQNAIGNGPYSGSVGNYDSLTLEATTTVPQLTLTRVNRTTIRLNWTSTGTGDRYDLQRRRIHTDGDTTLLETSWVRLPSDLLTDITYTDSGANFDPTDATSVKYEYRVQSLDANDNPSAWSGTKSVSIPELGAIVGTPTTLRAGPLSDSSIRISWGAVTGADFYELQWKTADRGYSSPIRRDSLFYEHTGLSPSTQYTYQVRAVDVNGAGDWSSPGSTSTRSTGTTGLQMPKVMGLKVDDATTNHDVVGRMAKLTWNAVPDATHYDIQRYDPSSPAGWGDLDGMGMENQVTSITKADAGSPPTHTDTIAAAAHGKTYFYVVSAVKQAGDTASAANDEMGEWSVYKSVPFKALKPAVPTALMAEMTTGTSIWVSWTATEGSDSASPPTDDATSYTLEWRTDETSTWTKIPVTGRVTYHHTGLNGNTAYRYRVRAENSGGSSPTYEPAGTDGVRVELGNRLAPPDGLQAVDATTGVPGEEAPTIKVSWTMEQGSSGYEVQRFDTTNNMWGDFTGATGAVQVVVSPSTTTVNHTGAMEGMTYLYRVRTVKGEAKSGWSAPASGTARAAIAVLDVPTLVATSTGVSMIRLSWNAVAGANNYELRFVEGIRSDTQIALIDPSSMTLSGAHRHYVHLNLKAGTPYSYELRAVFGPKVTTAWSTVAVQYTKPSPPNLTTTNATATSITLNWSAASFGGGRLAMQDNYHIQRRVTGEAWESVITPAGNDSENMVACESNVCMLVDNGVAGDDDGNDDGLKPNTRYFYRIRAADTVTPTGGAVTTYTSYWDYTRQSTSAASSN